MSDRGLITTRLRAGCLGAAWIGVALAGSLCSAGCGTAAAKERRAELENKVAAARELVGREESIRQDLEQSTTRLEEFKAYLPPSDRYAWAYEYVTHCAVQSQVAIDFFEEVTVDPLQDGGILGKPYEIRISTQCAYRDLLRLLWRIEKGNPLLRINRVTIAAGDDPMVHRVQIHLQWVSAL